MELRHLKYFIAVAEALSFSRAALQLRLAQPSLSTQIRDLEDELGLQLLERNRNRVALTDAGAVFLREAKQVLIRADKAVARAHEAAAGRSGELRVASMGPLTMSFLPACLTSLHSKVPNARMQVAELSPADQISQILSGRIHVGFIPAPFTKMSAGKALTNEKVLSSPLTILMSAEHPLHAKKSVRVKDFAGETFLHIIMFGSDAQRVWTQEVCRKNGFSPRFGSAAANGDNLISLVAAGSGVALIPKIAARPFTPGCVHVPVSNKGLEYELMAIYQPDFPSALRDTFLEIVRKEALIVQAELKKPS